MQKREWPARKVCVIAEAGVNHNGSLKTAKEMVAAAKAAGADYIKFQTWNPDAIVTRYAGLADYQEANIGSGKSQKEMLEDLRLSGEEFRSLFSFCQETGIRFLSTPFDIESIHFLDELGCELWKIPSGEVTNYPYLVEIAKTGKPIVMSTGMCELNEIDTAIKLLQDSGAGKILLLHCTTEYPAPYEDVNLNAMATLQERFGMEIGYSDHTKGIEVPIAAVAMGAVIIEKHFTLDRNMEGPDHKASLEPQELKAMISAIRNVEKTFGSGEKKPSESEKRNIAVVRKSIVAKRGIKKGEIFTEENITTKRPGNGISAINWPSVLGQAACRDFKEDDLIEL